MAVTLHADAIHDRSTVLVGHARYLSICTSLHQWLVLLHIAIVWHHAFFRCLPCHIYCSDTTGYQHSCFQMMRTA